LLIIALVTLIEIIVSRWAVKSESRCTLTINIINILILSTTPAATVSTALLSLLVVDKHKVLMGILVEGELVGALHCQVR